MEEVEWHYAISNLIASRIITQLRIVRIFTGNIKGSARQAASKKTPLFSAKTSIHGSLKTEKKGISDFAHQTRPKRFSRKRIPDARYSASIIG